ncbi:MAG: hypothetical protein FWB76_05360 [Oscillospiraceae bacterium]|nr:hypothetical protein [Oscillospiraceae bacterium]
MDYIWGLLTQMGIFGVLFSATLGLIGFGYHTMNNTFAAILFWGAAVVMLLLTLFGLLFA